MPADLSWQGQARQADRRRARHAIILEDVGITSNTLERYYTAVSRLVPVLESVNTEFEPDELATSLLWQPCYC